MTTTLTGKNQITVPAEITQKMGLLAGTQFEWKLGEEPNKIIITIKPSRRQLLDRLRAISLQCSPLPDDQIAILLSEREEDQVLRGKVLE